MIINVVSSDSQELNSSNGGVVNAPEEFAKQSSTENLTNFLNQSVVESYPTPIRILRPFVVWWSAVAQSIPRLIRQRILKSDLRPSQQNSNSSTLFHHVQHDVNDVNDVAAGLDLVLPESPPFEQTPLE